MPRYANRMTITLRPELTERLDRLAARDHGGKRSRAVAALIENCVTKSGEMMPDKTTQEARDDLT